MSVLQESHLTVAPSQGRELKHQKHSYLVKNKGVAPSQGRELKLEDEAKTSAYVLVAPSQGRELKPGHRCGRNLIALSPLHRGVN